MIYAIDRNKPLFKNLFLEVMKMLILSNSTRQLQKYRFFDEEKGDDSDSPFSTLKHSIK